MSKQRKLRSLAATRKATRWLGYNCLSDYHGGIYDCDHVSPYTQSARNLDADIFVLLQDWSSDLALSGPIDWEAKRLGYTPTEPTNRNLSELLKIFFNLELASVYASNLFPFIKQGNMTQRIPQRDLVRAALEFAIPQIEIVAPKVVICIGLGTFNAIRRACELRLVDNIDQGQQATFCIHGAEVWCQAHTGALGRINRNKGGIDRVRADWEHMSDSLRTSFNAF